MPRVAAVAGGWQVGSVIRNPEVSVLVPVLLAAIADPAKHTRPTLEVRATLLPFNYDCVNASAGSRWVNLRFVAPSYR